MTDKKQKLYLPVAPAASTGNLAPEDGFSRYLREINKIPSLSQEEEFLLAKAYLEQNDLDAAHKLVTSHLKLVAKMALSYRNYGLPMTELVSEGNLGLMQAVKKYNPALGFRLSTYAMWWIKAAIHEYILASWSLVKLGTTAAQKKLFFGLTRAKKKISDLYSRQVTDSDFSEIADELGVTIEDVKEMNVRLYQTDSSLNQTIGGNSENETRELIELLPEVRPNQEVILASTEEAKLKKLMLSKALGSLSERELAIFTSRRLSDEAETLDILSKKYNISKERVRQIENRAFEKVQNIILAEYEKLSDTGKNV